MMMQRDHYAAGANLNLTCNHRDCGTRDGGIRIQTAELMKMSFGCPDGRETVLISKLRAFNQEPVFIPGQSALFAVEIEEAELDRLPRLSHAGAWMRSTVGRDRRINSQSVADIQQSCLMTHWLGESI